MEFIAPLLQRDVIIALALGGSALAVVGSILLRKSSTINPRLARFVLRTGYTISWGSVVLFIVAGFLWR